MAGWPRVRPRDGPRRSGGGTPDRGRSATATRRTGGDGMSACEIVFDAETARKTDAMVELCSGHPCPGAAGGSCPILPRSISSIAKQHADPRAVEAYAKQRAAEQQAAKV